MTFFRALLIIFILGILIFTTVVGLNHGWDIFPLFFNDILALNWSGQFNLDFLCLLILSALWVAWRNKFSLRGIILGGLALVGGTMFLAPYLLIISFTTKGDIKKLLIG